MKIVSRTDFEHGEIELADGKVRKFEVFATATNKRISSSDKGVEIYSIKIDGKMINYNDKRTIYNADGLVLGTPKELYCCILELSEEDQLVYEYHLSAKSKKYMDGTLRNIGYIKEVIEVDDDTLKLEDEKMLYDFSTGSVWIGKHEGQHVLKIVKQYAIDGFGVDNVFFGHKPTMDDFKVYEAVKSMSFAIGFLSRGTKEYYNCYECGREVHWTDNNFKGIEQKKFGFDEKFCGFCDSI